jgi:predicted transposase YdaD
VLKRAHADLLVVDKQSRFYQTIKAEIAQYGRTWQKIAERDWVTDCVANGRLTWAVDRMEEEGGEEQDSFEEEEQVKPPGKGPGRPTGK